MTFEVKNIKTLGGTLSNNDGTFTQGLTIKVGPVGCTYSDIVSERNVPYTFPGTLSALEIEAGIATFAANWVAQNYPEI